MSPKCTRVWREHSSACMLYKIPPEMGTASVKHSFNFFRYRKNESQQRHSVDPLFSIRQMRLLYFGIVYSVDYFINALR